MADADPARELEQLRGRVTRLERGVVSARASSTMIGARVLVLAVNLGLFLSFALTWYVQTGSDDQPEVLTGWGTIGELIDTSGADVDRLAVFAGWYTLLVLLASLFAALGALVLRRRWIAMTLSPLLALLALGHLAVNGQANEDVERYPGLWTAMVLMLLTAVAWGTLAHRLRELELDLP